MGLHDLRFLPLNRILLDRAAKAGKLDLNGGTPGLSRRFAEGQPDHIGQRRRPFAGPVLDFAVSRTPDQDSVGFRR